MIIGNWSSKKIFAKRGGGPAKKGICVAHDALVFAIGVWIQQHRNKTRRTVEKVAEEVGRQIGRSVNYADVNAIENGDWHHDENFIAAVLHQVKMNNPEKVARLMKDIEKISGEIKEIVKIED